MIDLIEIKKYAEALSDISELEWEILKGFIDKAFWQKAYKEKSTRTITSEEIQKAYADR